MRGGGNGRRSSIASRKAKRVTGYSIASSDRIRRVRSAQAGHHQNQSVLLSCTIRSRTFGALQYSGEGASSLNSRRSALCWKCCFFAGHGKKLFVENKMRCVRHPSAPMPARLETLWRRVRMVPLALALLLCGVPIGVAPTVQAQSSHPAASVPGFIPAAPVRNRNRLPPYPDDALNLGRTGAVFVRLSITETGRISEVKVLRSSGSTRLDQATARWIETRWQYRPATLNGRPVASIIQFRVVYAITK